MTSLAFGPVTIHVYGICIAIGVIIFMYFIKKDTRFYSLGLEDHFDTLVSLGIISGIIGGRILYCLTHRDEITNWTKIFSVWDGGLSILGAVTAIITTLFYSLSYYQLPAIPFLDLVSLYAPLMHAAGRIGCFFAGCCHGGLWNGPWAIVYRSADSLALLDTPLHPSQLYSFCAFMIMFAFFYQYKKKLLQRKGLLFGLYLLLSGLERTVNEIFRYEYQIGGALISSNQMIGLAFILIGFILLINILLQSTCQDNA